jgi:hypothetical protein
VLRDVLELYKVQDIQQHAFVYLHCWIVLKDIPHWMDQLLEIQIRQPRRALPSPSITRRSSTITRVEDVGVAAGSPGAGDDIAPAAIAPSTNVGNGCATGKRFTRLVGSKQAKKELRNIKQKKSAMRA